MKIKAPLSVLVGAIALSFSILTQAAVQVTQITNDYNTTNNCSIVSAGGYNYHYSDHVVNVVVYAVDCPSESVVIYPQKTTTSYYWGGQFCEMTTYTSGYFIGGGCGNYRIYKN